MALYKRPGSKYYWLNLVFEGERHQISTKCKNKRDAEQVEAKYRVDLAERKVGLVSRKKMPTFEVAATEFLEHSEANNIASTHRRYVTASKAPIAFFRKAVNRITKEDVEDFVSWRKKQTCKPPARKLVKSPATTTKKPISAATINRELAFVRIVFNRLIERDYVIKNPVFKFKFLKENEDTFRVLERSEDNVYLIACSQPLRDIATVMLGSGLRPSEVFSLKKTDVNFDTGFLSITSGKTKAARRKVPMMSSVRKVLATRMNTPGIYLFEGGRGGDAGKPIVKLTNSHLRAVERSNLESFRLYDLRHTFASRCVEDGMDLVTLKDILGHSTIKMVLRYAHPSEQHRAEEMARIEKKRAAAM